MKFEFLKDYENHKKGDIVQLRQNFWTFYYQTKGIIVKYQPKPKNKGKKGKKNESV